MPLVLTLNGNVRRFEGLAEGASLSDLVAELALKADRVALEWNGQIAPRSQWGGMRVANGDRVELVHFVGGGALGVVKSPDRRGSVIGNTRYQV